MVSEQRSWIFPNFVQSYYIFINFFIFLFIVYNNLLYFEYAFAIQITVNKHTYFYPPPFTILKIKFFICFFTFGPPYRHKFYFRSSSAF